MRIASLQPSITLTLHALGRLETLCACTRYCVEALPELAELDIPILHDSWTADTAEIVAAEPSLVIASVPYRMESLAAILKSSMPVLALAPHALADMFSDILLLARLTDSFSQGAALVEQMKLRLLQISEDVTGLSRPRMYCEEWGKPLIHSQTWVAELAEAAGASFVGTPGAHTSAEAVVAADPDVLVFAWCGAGDRVPLARVIEQRGWQNLHAVQAGRVFCVPDEWLNTPAHTLVEGLDCLAHAAHPEMFARPPRLVSLGQPL